MADASDMELLRDYKQQGSEEAFALLVQRHINLVYSTALRHTQISAHAEEITRAVFVILARKAASLRPDTVLEAWLYETTRLASLNFLRGERRRQSREQEAYMQSIIQEPGDTSTWNQLAPLLDEAMARLGKKDREAVVLRFFKEKNLREVALTMNVTETAAQSRVHRALEKLRGYFSKQGVHSTTAVIAGEISAHSVHAAPVGLAKAVSIAAIAKGAAASTSTLTLVKGALKFMAWTQTKMAIAALAVVLLAAAGTTTVERIAEHQNDDWRLGMSDPKYLSALPYRTLILPTKADKKALTSLGAPGYCPRWTVPATEPIIPLRRCCATLFASRTLARIAIGIRIAICSAPSEPFLKRSFRTTITISSQIGPREREKHYRLKSKESSASTS
jgi:RNA polymerase sigma factor (sigma-70 family)